MPGRAAWCPGARQPVTIPIRIAAAETGPAAAAGWRGGAAHRRLVGIGTAAGNRLAALTRRGSRWPAVACLLAAIGLVAAGGTGLARADSGTVTRAVTVDGVPLLEVSPAGAATGRPGAVVAHGFAGSAVLMRGFADTLAARGYVVVLPDFTGHGRNPTPLPTVGGDIPVDPLQRDLATAVDHLRALPTVDPSRIVLVGHSMGAAAVVTFAAAHPEIEATVAISLGSAQTLPGDGDSPRNLLLIVGGAEFARFQQAALAGLHRSDPGLTYGETAGDPTAGTARRAVRVPRVEHISVLYATETHAETAAWLDRVVAAPAGGPVRPRERLVPAGLLVAGFLVGFVPVVAVLLPGRATERAPATPARPGPPPDVVRPRYAYGGLALALALAVPVAAVAGTDRLPLAVGGYAVGFFAVAGAVLLAASGLDRRHRWQPMERPGARHLAGAALLVGYAAVAVALPLHLGLTHALPVGARWWLLPVVIAATALLLLGTELVARGTRWRRPVFLVATSAALLLATVAGLAPGFVLLVLPLLVVLLAWHAGWAALLSRRQAPAWLPAMVGATVVGWPIATSLPLAG